MKTNEMTNTARPLTLEEIEALPLASVIWFSHTHKDNGVVWHWKDPVMVGAPGRNGNLVGGDAGGIIYHEINDKMLDDPNSTYWNQEPDDSQIPGITEAELNASSSEDDIVCEQLAEAITSRKVTFFQICNQTGIEYDRFMTAMTGKSEFTAGELAAIADALGTTVDEIFFRGEAAQI